MRNFCSCVIPCSGAYLDSDVQRVKTGLTGNGFQTGQGNAIKMARNGPTIDFVVKHRSIHAKSDKSRQKCLKMRF